jgi:hypothetical protein
MPTKPTSKGKADVSQNDAHIIDNLNGDCIEIVESAREVGRFAVHIEGDGYEAVLGVNAPRIDNIPAALKIYFGRVGWTDAVIVRIEDTANPTHTRDVAKETPRVCLVPKGKVYPDGALDIVGPLQVCPQGGGFQMNMRPEFLAKYDVHVDPKAEVLRKAYFVIDSVENDSFEGYTAGERWNGWAQPEFTKEEGLRLVEALCDTLRYDEAMDAFVESDEAYEEPTSYFGQEFIVDGELVTLYAIGAGCWTWSEEDESESEDGIESQVAKALGSEGASLEHEGTIHIDRHGYTFVFGTMNGDWTYERCLMIDGGAGMDCDAGEEVGGSLAIASTVDAVVAWIRAVLDAEGAKVAGRPVA